MWYVDDEEFEEAVESINKHGYSYCQRQEHIHDDKQSSLQVKRTPVAFKIKSADKSNGLSLFGTVPPPKKLSIDQVTQIASCVAESIRVCQPDGVVVYDIQDEPSRNGTERPFPFFHTHEPRMYSQLIERMAPEAETIIFRALTPNQSKEEFSDWISETINSYGGKNMVLVGGCRTCDEDSLLTVQEASKIIMDKHNELFLGGITIAERHRDKLNEHTRVYDKVDQGIGFFTSQVVYNADLAIWMLRDYDRLCKDQKREPVRIVFTFAPFGSEATVAFLRWLGVEIPDGTVKRALTRPTLKERVEESTQICWENWKRILDASKRLKIDVPLGFSVESVTKSKLEQEAAVDLFSSLKEEMQAYYDSRNKSVTP